MRDNLCDLIQPARLLSLILHFLRVIIERPPNGHKYEHQQDRKQPHSVDGMIDDIRLQSRQPIIKELKKVINIKYDKTSGKQSHPSHPLNEILRVVRADFSLSYCFNRREKLFAR